MITVAFLKSVYSFSLQYIYVTITLYHCLYRSDFLLKVG